MVTSIHWKQLILIAPVKASFKGHFFIFKLWPENPWGIQDFKVFIGFNHCCPWSYPGLFPTTAIFFPAKRFIRELISGIRNPDNHGPKGFNLNPRSFLTSNFIGHQRLSSICDLLNRRLLFGVDSQGFDALRLKIVPAILLLPQDLPSLPCSKIINLGLSPTILR